jgi:hypothetical protein
MTFSVSSKMELDQRMQWYSDKVFRFQIGEVDWLYYRRPPASIDQQRQALEAITISLLSPQRHHAIRAAGDQSSLGA